MFLSVGCSESLTPIKKRDGEPSRFFVLNEKQAYRFSIGV